MTRRLTTIFAGVYVCLAAGACGGDAKGDGKNSDNVVSCEDDVCVLSGTISENLTLTADKQWVLHGGVFVGDDNEETQLTIEAGTQIYGETSSLSMLVITRGSKIFANGTAEAPIVFTSSKEPGSRARGDWGGLIINGWARINSCSEDGLCEALGEGGTGYYGGDDDTDDSGILRYVRIEFAGRLVSPDNELNGLALQGVGSGTVIENLQIHMPKDDGIEFFGGTVGFRYVLVTGAADDSLDWTDGWRGKGQFFVAQQYDDAGDNGIEADNNGERNDATPRSEPTLSNITLIGSPDSTQSNMGMLLREGTGAHIQRALVLGWNQACLDIDHSETFSAAVDDETHALTGVLTITESMIDCATPFAQDADDLFDVSTFFQDQGNWVGESDLDDPYNAQQPSFKPGSGAALTSTDPLSEDDFFISAAFLGGVDPAFDWTAGWTSQVRD